jgi:hypothetical protein
VDGCKDEIAECCSAQLPAQKQTFKMLDSNAVTVAVRPIPVTHDRVSLTNAGSHVESI